MRTITTANTRIQPMAEETRPGYRFTVQGQYYAPSGDEGKTALKFFKGEVFELPEVCRYPMGKKFKTVIKDGKEVQIAVPRILKSNVQNVALHLIRRYHLLPRLREKYPGAVDVRICEIVKREKIQISIAAAADVETLAINDMNEAQLRQFHAINDLTSHLDDYADLVDKKAAVAMELDQIKRDQVVASAKTPLIDEEVDAAPIGQDPNSGGPVDGELVDDGAPLDGLLS